MDKDLKPCPFCGSEAKLYVPRTTSWEKDENTKFYRLVDTGSSGMYIVQCAQTRCPGHNAIRWRTEAEAITAWNRRV